MSIFIQIASYRDPELLHTLRDCIRNSEFPDNLTFCICWQRAETDSLEEFTNDTRFIIIDVPYAESKGCCWARNQIQQKYTDQMYTLQLDSHHRFIKNWDTILINMYNDLVKKGHPKPLITAYASSYDPENDPEKRVLVPWKINFSRITSDNNILFIPGGIDNSDKLTEPIPADFYSAHFAFTTGNFCKEVQHDPGLYFTGEEMNITIRAFTYGYDLFHPHIVIAWHEYTRKNRIKHWDEHKNWSKIDELSKKKYCMFIKKLLMDDITDTSYGIGLRNIKEYSRYDLIVESVYPSKKTIYNYVLDVPQHENIKFMFFGIHDIDDKQLYRQDIYNEEKHIQIKVELSKNPYKYIWWPFFKETGWGEKVEVIL